MNKDRRSNPSRRNLRGGGGRSARCDLIGWFSLWSRLVAPTGTKGRHSSRLVPPTGTKGGHWSRFVAPTGTKGWHWSRLVPRTGTKGLHWSRWVPRTGTKGLHGVGARKFSPTSLVEERPHWFISAAAAAVLSSSLMQAYGPNRARLCLWAFWAFCGPESWPN